MVPVSLNCCPAFFANRTTGPITYHVYVLNRKMARHRQTAIDQTPEACGYFSKLLLPSCLLLCNWRLAILLKLQDRDLLLPITHTPVVMSSSFVHSLFLDHQPHYYYRVRKWQLTATSQIQYVRTKQAQVIHKTMDSITAQQLSPTRTVVTSFSPRKPSTVGTSATSAFEEGDWVLCLAVANRQQQHNCNAKNSNTISCALSNGTVHVYDQQRLHVTASFSPGQCSRNNLITDMIYYDQHESSCTSSLITTAQDGSVVVTDLRQAASSTPAAALSTCVPRGESALSIDLGLDGHIAAVASNKASIHFFDVRYTNATPAGNDCTSSSNNHLLGSYRDSHHDAVTKVKFHPQQSSMLCSGGEDGLICCFDTTQPTEELALQSVLNVGAPVRQMGFCCDHNNCTATALDNSSSGSLYCLTGNETASLWDINTATCLQDFGGTQFREVLTHQTSQLQQRQQQPSSAAEATATSSTNKTVSSVPIQYLVDAYWDAPRRELLLCAGNSEGDAALFVCRDGATWQLQNTLVGGHRGVVRAWRPMPPQMGSGFVGGVTAPVTTIVTVGEDARLCEWNRLAPAPAQRRPSSSSPVSVSSSGTPAAAPAVASIHSSASLPSLKNAQGGGPVRRQRRHSHKTSAAPY